MKLSLSVESYKGVDGSSLSPTRCSQMVQVYEMLEALGSTVISYVGIQEEADTKKLFGKTKAKSAIRTFFPLLKKIDFVDYDGDFAANKCFTELGTQFVLACRALDNVTEDTPHKEEIISRLASIKRNAQIKGLINMYNNPEWKNHISDIKKNKNKIDLIEFVNEDGDVLPNTCYSYLRSYLEECGLIYKVSSLESKLSDEADLFYSHISL